MFNSSIKIASDLHLSGSIYIKMFKSNSKRACFRCESERKACKFKMTYLFLLKIVQSPMGNIAPPETFPLAMGFDKGHPGNVLVHKRTGTDSGAADLCNKRNDNRFPLLL